MEFSYSPLPNHKQRLDIYIPQKPKNVPVLVFIHGGAWRTGDKGEYRFVGDFLAKQGISCVIPSYPLTTAKGQNSHPCHLKSVALAISWVYRYSSFYTGVPCDSIILSGHSAGAYMAAKLCLEPQYLEAVGGQELVNAIIGWIGIDGIYNIPQLIDVFPNYTCFIEPAFSTDKNAWTLASVNAAYFKGKALLIHAKDDELVNEEQTRQLYDALQQMQCLVVYDNEFTGGHDGMLRTHELLFQFLAAYDPFADTGDNNELQVQGYIHIRIQQRNGRKTLTTVQGLPADLDQKRILKAFKKEFACNGTVIEDEELGEVIQLQGDQRLKVQQFLITQEIATKDKVKIHGF